MTIVDSAEYNAQKKAFIKKHKGLKRVDTSSMDEYSSYHKEYICEDNAMWYEVMSPYYKTVEMEINKCKVSLDVKLFQTEFWDSDNSNSRFYYENY